jgi:hypothetical protein
MKTAFPLKLRIAEPFALTPRFQDRLFGKWPRDSAGRRVAPDISERSRNDIGLSEAEVEAGA